MPTIYEHAKNIPRIKKGRELLCWILYQNHEILCFSSNVRQCNIACSVVHVQLCFKSVLLIILVSWRQG